MLPRPQWIEYHLNADGEWVRGATDRTPGPPPSRTVLVVRVWFERERRHEVRPSTPAAAAYLEKLLAAHPFEASAVRRWAVYHRQAPFMMVLARSRYEAALQGAAAGAAPAELEVKAEEELDGVVWATMLNDI